MKLKLKHRLVHAGLALAAAVPLLTGSATALKAEASSTSPIELVRSQAPTGTPVTTSGVLSPQSVRPATANPGAAPAATSASHVNADGVETAPDGREARAGSLLVTFRANAEPAARQVAHQQASSLAVEPVGKGKSVRVQVQPGTIAKAMAAYAARPDVERVEPDYIVYASMTPNDPKFSEEWGLSKIGAPAAWDRVGGAPGVKVAVLDTGILDHTDLTGRVVAAKDFTNSPHGPSDRHGHGTHVAGTIAALANNSTGVVGIAWNASLLNGKVLGDSGSGAISSVANGITWATDNGAKVISMSLGANTACPATLQEAVDYAWSHGVVLFAAAGNDGASAVHSPANCTNVVPVGAVDSNDERPAFSNYGPNVPIAAPGVFVLSTYHNGDYMWMSGTSMATPHAAGVAALIWASPYGTGNEAVVSRLFSTADRIAGTGSVWTYGRINAAAAVGATGGTSPAPAPSPSPTTPAPAPSPSPSPSPSPTPAPSPSPVPAPPLSCNPRPNVSVKTVATGQGSLAVTLTAGNSGQGGNRLKEVRFGSGSNATIDTGTRAAAGNFSVSLPASTTEYTFSVKRSTNGAVTVPLIVIDNCGEWQTLIGGGANAF